MAEPTTTATVAGLSAIAFLPFINGDAMLGAVLGASTYSQHVIGHRHWLHQCATYNRTHFSKNRCSCWTSYIHSLPVYPGQSHGLGKSSKNLRHFEFIQRW